MQQIKEGAEELVALVQLMLNEKGCSCGRGRHIRDKDRKRGKKLPESQGIVGRRDRGEQHVRQAVYRLPIETREPGRAGKSAANKAE